MSRQKLFIPSLHDNRRKPSLPESGVESLRPNGTAVNSGSCVSPAPGTEGGSSADLSSSLSQSTEDIAEDTVGS